MLRDLLIVSSVRTTFVLAVVISASQGLCGMVKHEDPTLHVQCSFDDKGNALYYAVQSISGMFGSHGNLKKITRLLVRNGADPSVKDTAGRTPLDIKAKLLG